MYFCLIKLGVGGRGKRLDLGHGTDVHLIPLPLDSSQHRAFFSKLFITGVQPNQDIAPVPEGRRELHQ
jgi:hypothetical protein